MIILIPEFPTHIAKTNNKIAPNKYIKINNQAIYNSNLNRFARNIVMKNLHDYIRSHIKRSKRRSLSFPVRIAVRVNTVRNHASISRRGGIIRWKPPDKKYIPNWDIENLASMWVKAICDSLVKEGILPDDNIEYVEGIEYSYHEVEDLKDRFISIGIHDG